MGPNGLYHVPVAVKPLAEVESATGLVTAKDNKVVAINRNCFMMIIS